eukprot:gnl/MRDRNA2_/MRDRNA2_284299_c0_seq1.p1 gnl/MRDRNA2_/MRDRNA2_284299_c0~~gnl/MRDRNA2_/MRDRNA2_284299_c0_seq1.p1  ORF type:complete len:247 (-),score=32.64 gnl/MRDRNA2_/MRDRNA2_284299_c0_seq1:62-727(-)
MGALSQASVITHSLWWLVFPGALYFITGAVMLLSSLVFKRRHAENVLMKYIPDFGAGRILDVGTGHGLMLFTALQVAERAGCTNAHGTGIDIWNNFDQASNSAEQTMKNAHALGLQDRVTLKDADARSLPFENDSFDVVVSSYMVHNLSKADDRASVIREMLRTLRPGGTLIVTDINYTKQYAQVAESIMGVSAQLTKCNGMFCLLTRSMIATKTEIIEGA